MDGFAEVVELDVGGGFEVGDGAGEAEDFVVGAGAEAEFLAGLFEERFARFVEFAEFADFARGHAGVGAVGGETGALVVAGGDDLFAQVGAGGAGLVGAEVAVGDGGDFDVNVDAIEERAGDAAHVGLDLARGAAALVARVAVVAAGTGVEGGDEGDGGGEGERALDAGDGDDAVFEGLAEDFEGFLVELG